MSGEFERQFYGDIMLFSIERLTNEGRSLDNAASTDFSGTLNAVRAEMLEKYNARQRAILEKLRVLEALLSDTVHWWNLSPEHAVALGNFKHFATNVERNFGTDSPGHTRINAADNWAKWRANLLEAIALYPEDRQAWEKALCAG
jgi:hypothetical protein